MKAGRRETLLQVLWVPETDLTQTLLVHGSGSAGVRFLPPHTIRGQSPEHGMFSSWKGCSRVCSALSGCHLCSCLSPSGSEFFWGTIWLPLLDTFFCRKNGSRRIMADWKKNHATSAHLCTCDIFWRMIYKLCLCFASIKRCAWETDGKEMDSEFLTVNPTFEFLTSSPLQDILFPVAAVSITY